MIPDISSEDENGLSDDLSSHSDDDHDEDTIPTHLEYKSLNESMTEAEKSDLCAKLTVEYRKITSKFSRLNCKIRSSLKDRKITPQQLAVVLMEMSAFSLLNNNVMPKPLPLLEERFKEIEAAKNVEAVFTILCPYGSFFDCHILKHIVHSKLCTAKDRKLLKKILKPANGLLPEKYI